MSRLAVIGSGYVGLVAGACFAEAGHDVICVDTDAAKVEALSAGRVPIYEPGLEDLVLRGLASGRLRFTTHIADALREATVAIIAVGTPPRAADGHADMAAVLAVADAIGRNAVRDMIVVAKSTVPVGTGDEIEQILRRVNPARTFSVVSNPEFLREGNAIADFMTPERIVIGAEDEASGHGVAALYQAEAFGAAPVLYSSRRSAELLKYAANAFLATKITFINEIADLCDAVGADVADVARGMGLDSRIGRKFLNAGPGFGGSCFPKDTLAIARTARDHDVNLRVVDAVIESNDRRKLDMATKVVDACGGTVEGRRIAILGLAFKAGTDDLRESPSLPIVRTLQALGADIRAYDPKGGAHAAALLPGVAIAPDAYAAAAEADAVVLVTEWPEFAGLDLGRLRGIVRAPVIVDLRNMLDGDAVHAAGFDYWRLDGRKLHRDLYLAAAAE